MPATYDKFFPLHYLPEWQPLAPAITAHAAGGGLAYDLRRGLRRDSFIYQWAASGSQLVYNPLHDEWMTASTVAGAIGAGSMAFFVPSAGPAGTLAAGWSTTTGALTTPLATTVGMNHLANRGDGIGYWVRIIGNAGGSSGLTDVKQIVANTAGTTPTITLDSPLSFTPALGDRYELLSGRVFYLGTAPTWAYYDIATGTTVTGLSVVNMTATATDGCGVVLDEQYVPQGRLPDQGFFDVCTATATTAGPPGTLTGTAGGADATRPANEFRNFQLRIVEDPGTPTSVGQRVKIASHTGPSPTVYTLTGAWPVATPSNIAKYVVEAIGDVVYFGGSSTTVFTKAVGGFRADADWATAAAAGGGSLQFAVRPSATAAGMGAACWPFGFSLDAAKNNRWSGIYITRGGTGQIDCCDITTLDWATGVGGQDVVERWTRGPSDGAWGTGTCGVYDPNGPAQTKGGRYWYINHDSSVYSHRVDLLNRVMMPWCRLRQPQSTAAVGQRMGYACAVDGTDYGPYIYMLGATQANFQRVFVPF